MENKQIDLWENLNKRNTLGEVQKYIKEVIEIRGFDKQKLEQNRSMHIVMICMVT